MKQYYIIIQVLQQEDIYLDRKDREDREDREDRKDRNFQK
jgi:hypothetical protein